MPELPDVEIYRKYIHSTSLHKKITDIKVNAHKVVENKDDYIKMLIDNQFKKTQRHGKYLFISLKTEKQLLMHFGMTGRLDYFKSSQECSKYSNLDVFFDNNYVLSFIAPRKLGKLKIINDTSDFINENNLGEDALKIDFDSFRKLVQAKKGMLKSTLMDQSVIAGIGNIYSDEILFQAGFHPRYNVNNLSNPEIKTIYKTINNVLTTAIDKQADPDKFPDSFLLPHRQKGADCPTCKGMIEKIKISGRGAYVCSNCQKK